MLQRAPFARSRPLYRIVSMLRPGLLGIVESRAQRTFGVRLLLASWNRMSVHLPHLLAQPVRAGGTHGGA